MLKDLSSKTVRSIQDKVEQMKRQGDICIASIHWGGNWGYTIPRKQIKFAHSLIDQAGVDIIYGHSSHHVKAIEVYKGKPILYGCGDFLNDYEGIKGYEQFRGDLGLMYFVSMDPQTGQLVRLQMTPTQVRNFRVGRASRADALWLRDTLNRERVTSSTRVELNSDNVLMLQWD